MALQVLGIFVCLALIQMTVCSYDTMSPIEIIFENDTISAYSDPPRLSNIGYLGGSYNIFKGNPQAIGRSDPGFVNGQNIFQHTYTQKKTTTDGRYLIPDGTTVNSVDSCSFAFSSSITSTTQAYSDSLKVHVDADFQYFGASFSASSDYQKVKQSTSSGQSVFVSSQAECQTYGASIDHDNLSPAFIGEVKALPTSASSSLRDYMTFIGKWGTHIASSLMMGGRYGIRSEFTSSNFNDMVSSKLNIKAAGGYSGAIASVSASLATDVQTRQANSFDSKRKNYQIFQLGGKPPVDSTVTTFLWAQTVRASPMPLSYKLTEIYKYLTTQYITGDTHLALKQQKLQLAIAQHCKQIVPNPALCDARYGPKSSGEKMRVIIGGRVEKLTRSMNSGDATWYLRNDNPLMRNFGGIKGPWPTQNEYSTVINSPFVMVDSRSITPNLARKPIGTVGVSANQQIKRMRCPTGFSTVSDQAKISVSNNFVPPQDAVCIANHCLTDCRRGQSCGGTSKTPNQCYYISGGQPELGNPDNKGFFRDLSISDSTPQSDLFKCLSYSCLELDY